MSRRSPRSYQDGEQTQPRYIHIMVYLPFRRWQGERGFLFFYEISIRTSKKKKRLREISCGNSNHSQVCHSERSEASPQEGLLKHLGRGIPERMLPITISTLCYPCRFPLLPGAILRCAQDDRSRGAVLLPPACHTKRKGVCRI